jgi:hypothetical protein
VLLSEVGTRLFEPLPGVHLGLTEEDAEELLPAPADDRIEWPEPLLQGKEKVSVRPRVSRAATAEVITLVDPDHAEHERALGSLGARDLVTQDDLTELPPVGTGRFIDEGPLDFCCAQFAVACGEVAANSVAVASDCDAEPDCGGGRALLARLLGTSFILLS